MELTHRRSNKVYTVTIEDTLESRAALDELLVDTTAVIQELDPNSYYAQQGALYLLLYYSTWQSPQPTEQPVYPTDVVVRDLEGLIGYWDSYAFAKFYEEI